MLALGVTGGICTGKSLVACELTRLLGWQRFDADKEVHQFLATDKEVIQAVSTSFPRAVIQGRLNRDLLREQILRDPSRRRALEEILHPPVWKALEHFMNRCRENNLSIVAEIPLLFETGSGHRFDRTILVGASQAEQMRRLTEVRKICEVQAEGLISAQWPVEKKIQQADYILWNDGSRAFLQLQIQQFARFLERPTGVSKA